MRSLIGHTLSTLFLPGLLLFAVFYGQPYASALTTQWQALLLALPYMIASVNVLLCLKFHRSTCLQLSLLAIGLLLYQSSPLLQSYLSALDVGLLLISNALLCCVFRETHFFTLRSTFKWGIFIAQISGLVWIGQNTQVWHTITRPIEQHLPHYISHISISEWMLYGMISTAVVIFLRGYHSALRRSYFGTFTALFLAFHYSDQPWLFQALISTALCISLYGLLSHLHSIAFLDDLTQIPARRALNERLSGLTGQYCLAMIDIDHFKKFNDTHGHDLGDKVLYEVANTIKRCVGHNAYRYGGEEFTIVFSSGNTQKAMDKLEQIREAVEQTRIKCKKDKRNINVSVTISIGCANKHGKHKSPQQVIKQADQALYKAKKKGRNQTCLSA